MQGYKINYFVLIPNCAGKKIADLSTNCQTNHFSPAEQLAPMAPLVNGAGIQRITDYKEDTVTAGRIFVTKGLIYPQTLGSVSAP